ncbi:tectonic-3-like [Thalassophryne amazonica]|uniref:tectonic-3-like n=1 Tax=Thalassophryne amazonica TaxID=390379 RepID=UPI001470DB74|nr:tectonic-3-like [Thalassophryne amazonica]
MNSVQWRCSVQIVLVLCGCLIHAATKAGITSAVTGSPTQGEALSTVTPAPRITEDPVSTGTDAGTTEAFTVDSSATLFVSTALPVNLNVSHGCLCDLTPDFCDIGCCCDTADCGIANLSTVFTGCPERVISGVCIERWLMFKANVDPSLVTVTDSLFCVQPKVKAAVPQTLSTLPLHVSVGDSYHFSPPETTFWSVRGTGFYKVDDVILTYFTNSSLRGVLRQPSPGPAATFCLSYNPARFLRSTTMSCTRVLTRHSCTTDPALSAHSYFSNFSLVKIPQHDIEMSQMLNFLIPVTPLSEWPAPKEHDNICMNVVKKVEFVIGYRSTGELVYAKVDVVLAEGDLNHLLLQMHAVQFELDTPSPDQTPLPAVGLGAGSPVVGRFGEAVEPLTTVRVSQGGGCSSDPSARTPVLFTHNIITGCTFSSPSSNCSELRSQIYKILLGSTAPEQIAMNSGSQPDWARVITQECSIKVQETCALGCVLPYSLSVRVLWARQGLLDLPQNYILGAKYLFHCRIVKCPVMSPISLSTEVNFADATLHPEAPRGRPQPHWKFPFGFFTRGAAEFDGCIIANRTDSEKLAPSFLMFTLMLLKGLEYLLNT